jgi:hypothetical protein
VIVPKLALLGGAFAGLRRPMRFVAARVLVNDQVVMIFKSDLAAADVFLD